MLNTITIRIGGLLTTCEAESNVAMTEEQVRRFLADWYPDAEYVPMPSEGGEL